VNFKKVLFFSIIVILFSCTESTKRDGIVINGKFQNASGIKVFFREVDVDSIHDLDSAILDENGFFRFKCKLLEPGFYVVKSISGEYIFLLLEKNEEVTVDADFRKQPFNYTVNGSPGSELLKEFYDLTLPNLIKADSLRSVLMQNRESPDFYKLSLSFDTIFMKIFDDQKIIEKAFIDKNQSSLASLIVLNYKFGMMPVLNTEEDFPIFLKLDSALSMRYPANKHAVFHHQRVIEHQRQDREKQSLKKSKF
jgi:Domain of unknown function (DUF4369)